MLYYVDRAASINGRGIKCLNPETGKVLTLNDSTPEHIFIDNGTLYYKNYYETDILTAIALDGSGTTEIELMSPARMDGHFITGGYFYFTRDEDGYDGFSRFNIERGVEEKITDDHVGWASEYGSKLYIWNTNNVSVIDLETRETQKLQSVSGYNFFQNNFTRINATSLGVYFYNSEGAKIEHMSHDGKTRTVAIQGGSGGFCITRNWIVYVNLDDDENLWAMSIDGSTSVRLDKSP